MLSLLHDMEKVERAAFLHKWRHNGTSCFAELKLKDVSTGYWVRVCSLRHLCYSISISNPRRVLRTLRNCVSTPLLRKEYAIDFPQFPLLVRDFAISTLNGIYRGDTDSFYPFKYPSAKRVPFATRLCYAVGKRRIPEDILKHILDYIVPTHIKPMVATMNFIPVNWLCFQSRENLSIDALPDFAHNIAAHKSTPVAIHETCVRFGQLIQCGGSVTPFRIVVSDKRVFRRSPLYELLCSIMCRGVTLASYTSALSSSRDIHLLGDPSTRKETRVMDVIRLCVRLYMKDIVVRRFHNY